MLIATDRKFPITKFTEIQEKVLSFNVTFFFMAERILLCTKPGFLYPFLRFGAAVRNSAAVDMDAQPSL